MSVHRVAEGARRCCSFVVPVKDTLMWLAFTEGYSKSAARLGHHCHAERARWSGASMCARGTLRTHASSRPAALIFFELRGR